MINYSTKKKDCTQLNGAIFFNECHLRGLSLLLKASYDLCLQSGYTHHAISLLNNEPNTIRAFFENGYGSRCIDALWQLQKTFDVDYKGYSVTQATSKDMKAILPIIEEHDHYMCASPTLLGFTYDTASDQYENWMNDDDTLVWKITKDDVVYGIMKTTIGKSDGCDSISDNKTIGIQTTHVLEQYRGYGVGKILVEHIADYAIHQGYEKLSVDYESLNPSANGFWKKWFTPVITSVTRYIGK